MPTPAGTVPDAVVRAFDEGLLDLPARPRGLAVSAVQNQWRLPIIMVSFSDEALTYGPADFDLALFDTTQATATGSVFDYYQWVSAGRLTLQGQVVAVVNLPHPKSYYGGNAYGLNRVATPKNLYGAIYDALQVCDSLVNWSDFDLDHDGYVDMLWFLHAGLGGESGTDLNSFWSITSRLSGGWRNGEAFVTSDSVPGSSTQFMRVDRFSSLPELSNFVPGARSEIGVYCHEFGHALGLPDLYDTSQLGGAANVGPGNWSLMSTGVWGTDGHSPSFPAHMGAWPMVFLGWIQSSRPTEDSTLTIAPIERNAPVVEFWFQGESNPEHFLIENRQREGFDRNLPEPGLVVYHVDEAAIGAGLPGNRINAGLNAGLRLVEADGDYDLLYGRNRGDANDPFPGAFGRTFIDDATAPSTRTFSGSATNLALRDITPVGSDVRFLAQVRAAGWLPPADQTDVDFAPVNAYGPAITAAADVPGNIYTVRAESRTGRPQIVLRTRFDQGWQPAVQVSNTPAYATEPSLAVLPNGDLAVVWSDLRGGRSRIFYRARIAGSWTPEQVLVDLPGDCYSPALGSDGRGMLQLAFLNVAVDRPSVQFMRFTYLSPFGIPFRVTGPDDYPSAPTVATGRDGRCYVLWSERLATPQKLWFVRFHPDSGLSNKLSLTPGPYYAEASVQAAVDGAGVLHCVWQVVGPGVNQLHYQRRDFSKPTWLPDTLLESQGTAILNPNLAIDPSGGVHLAFELSRPGGQQIRYRRKPPASGWDFRSTEVTRESEGSAYLPAVVPFSPGNVTVLYTGYPQSDPRFMERRRLLDPPPLLAAPAPMAGTIATLALGPNPLRSGQALELRWSGPGPEPEATVDLFDVAGRRVASVALHRNHDTYRGRLDGGVIAGWPDGLYFAHLRGEHAIAARLVVLR